MTTCNAYMVFRQPPTASGKVVQHQKLAPTAGTKPHTAVTGSRTLVTPEMQKNDVRAQIQAGRRRSSQLRAQLTAAKQEKTDCSTLQKVADGAKGLSTVLTAATVALEATGFAEAATGIFAPVGLASVTAGAATAVAGGIAGLVGVGADALIKFKNGDVTDAANTVAEELVKMGKYGRVQKGFVREGR